MEKSANYSYKIKSGYVFDIQVRNVCGYKESVLIGLNLSKMSKIKFTLNTFQMKTRNKRYFHLLALKHLVVTTYLGKTI